MQIGVFKQSIQHFLRIEILFDFYNGANACSVGLVPYIADAGEYRFAFLLNERKHLLKRGSLIDRYGNSVITIFVFPFLSGSKCVFARLMSFPLPVSYAVRISAVFKRYPPTGKSGQGNIFIRSSRLISGFLIFAITASIASVGLCGGTGSSQSDRNAV